MFPLTFCRFQLCIRQPSYENKQRDELHVLNMSRVGLLREIKVSWMLRICRTARNEDKKQLFIIYSPEAPPRGAERTRA